jgi:hypothetical protein
LGMKQLGRVVGFLPTVLLFTACERPQDEFIAALPDRETMILDIEEGQSSQGLRPANGDGTDRHNLVGAPAEWYTNTYYAARDLNVLAGFIVTVLEEVTKLPPSGLTDKSAVWGPLSDPKEPNEFILNIEKVADSSTYYQWAIKGKHKSSGIDAYISLAAGAFEPSEVKDQGRGWFVIDFEAIRTLNPTEKGHGRIAYALQKNDEGTLVLAHYKGLDDAGNNIQASYAYGEDNKNAGFIVFRLPADIDDGEDGKVAVEDVLIRTRFSPDGGRADIFATHGDLGSNIVIGSQCWDSVFVSSFEQFKLGEEVLASAGDSTSCAFAEAETPDVNALPDADEVESPYTLEELMR